MAPQSPRLARRSFCLCCMAASSLAATGGWLSPREAYAEARGLVSLIKDSAATSPIMTHKLRNNISVLEGSGGNVAVLTGPDGKVLVDAGISVSRARMTKALAGLSNDPITHLINTHWHFDHADGNTWLHELGAKIIAQENTRKYLSQVQRVEDWDYNFLRLPASGLPTEVFARERNLKLNGASIELKYYGPAHTDCDISVTFAEADVVHVGDTFWNGIYPFIDYSTGGSIDGMIAASDANLAATTDKTIIIPGHGKPVSNRAELKAFRDMLVGVRENVAKLKKQGRIAGRNGRRQADRPLRCGLGTVRHRPRLLHAPCLRGRLNRNRASGARSCARGLLQGPGHARELAGSPFARAQCARGKPHAAGSDHAASRRRMPRARKISVISSSHARNSGSRRARQAARARHVDVEHAAPPCRGAATSPRRGRRAARLRPRCG